MKKLISVAAAIIAVFAMTIPAFAETVDTHVTVGTDSTAPYMIALTVTPDDTAGDGVQVDPEFAVPNSGGTFPPVDVGSDGWKRVKFYVEVGHINGITNIDSVAVDVNYPASFLPEDDALFSARAGTLKFEINAGRVGSAWGAQIVYPYAETYPGNVPAVLPALGVRELVYGTASDIVDVNADDTLGNDSDATWQNFLTSWGVNRVRYASSYDAASAFDKYQLGQALVLEITGWMWFHQPGVTYPVAAKAATAGGATSAVLSETSRFLRYNRVFGLYVDFSTVNFLNVNVGGTSWAEGDRFLTTPELTTVWNNGNVGAQVLVSSTKMVKDFTGTAAEIHSSIYYNSLAKTIEHFDAQLYFTNGAGAVVQLGKIDYLADAAPTVIANGGSGTGTTGPVLLQACRPAKIEFSVHPELGEMQEAGNYKGFLTVSIGSYTGSQLPTP